MAVDLYADVALLEKHGFGAFTKQGVTKTRLQPAPARSHRTGNVAHVFIVHRQYGAQSVAFHRLAGATQAVLAQPLPVDALLPIRADQTETRGAAGYHGASSSLIARTLLQTPISKSFERSLSISSSSRFNP